MKFAGENIIPKNQNQGKHQNLRLFTFEKLASATNNFNPDNLLGPGGFGLVYRVINYFYIYCTNMLFSKLIITSLL